MKSWYEHLPQYTICMKSFISIAFVCVLASCTAKKTSEKLLQDSTRLTTASLDSAVNQTNPEPAIVISDSATQVLRALVDSRLDTVYNALSDSANFYKVELIEYYDEYEGQDEMKRYIWFFDKQFSIAYSKYSYQNGAMQNPDIKECITQNNIVTCVKESGDSNTYGNLLFTIWDAKSGGTQFDWSTYSKGVESIKPLLENYSEQVQQNWDSNLLTLQSFIESEEPTNDNETYLLLKEVPKHADLVDYTKVTIPKAVYHKLKSN